MKRTIVSMYKPKKNFCKEPAYDDYPSNFPSDGIINMTLEEEDLFCRYYEDMVSKKVNYRIYYERFVKMIDSIPHSRYEFIKRVLKLEPNEDALIVYYARMTRWYYIVIQESISSGEDLPFDLYYKMLSLFSSSSVLFPNNFSIRVKYENMSPDINEFCDYDMDKKVKLYSTCTDNDKYNFDFSCPDDKEEIAYFIQISEYIPKNLTEKQINILGIYSINNYYYDLFDKCVQKGYTPSNDLVRSLLDYDTYLGIEYLCKHGNYIKSYHCDSEYEKILKDVLFMSNTQLTLSDICSTGKIGPCKFLKIILNCVHHSIKKEDISSLYDRCIYPPLISSTGRYNLIDCYEDFYYKYYVSENTLNTKIVGYRYINVGINVNKMFNNIPQVQLRELFNNQSFSIIKKFIRRYKQIVFIDQYCVNNMYLHNNTTLIRYMNSKKIMLPPFTQDIEKSCKNLYKAKNIISLIPTKDDLIKKIDDPFAEMFF